MIYRTLLTAILLFSGFCPVLSAADSALVAEAKGLDSLKASIEASLPTCVKVERHMKGLGIWELRLEGYFLNGALQKVVMSQPGSPEDVPVESLYYKDEKPFLLVQSELEILENDRPVQVTHHWYRRDATYFAKASSLEGLVPQPVALGEQPYPEQGEGAEDFWTKYSELIREVFAKCPKGGRMPPTWAMADPQQLATQMMQAIEKREIPALEKLLSGESTCIGYFASEGDYASVNRAAEILKDRLGTGTIVWKNQNEFMSIAKSGVASLTLITTGWKPQDDSGILSLELRKTDSGSWEWSGIMISCENQEP